MATQHLNGSNKNHPHINRTQKIDHCNLVYLIDDNVNNHETFTLTFQQMNYKVKIFVSLSEFTHYYQGNNFKRAIALFIDINVVNKPERNLTYSNLSAEIEKHLLPTVVISETDNLMTRLKLLRKGYENFIQKPIKPSQLSELFNRIGIVKPVNSYRVLVVDDDKMLLMLLEDALTDAGMEVCTISEPLNIFDVIDSFNPDVMLLDEHMPEIKGSELATVLKRHIEYDNIPILFLSGEKDPLQQMKAIKNGGVGFLCKPIDEKQLIASITVVANETWGKKALQQKLKFIYNEREREHLALDRHAIVSITDRKGCIKYANNKFCQISGYNMTELIGENHRMLKSDKHPKEFYQEMWHKIYHGETWHGIICNLNKKKSYYWVESTIIPFLDENGQPYQYLSIRTDITDLKTKEIDLAQQNKMQKIISDVTLNLLTCQESEHECLISSILEEIVEFIQVDQSVILTYNDETAQLEPFYRWCNTQKNFDQIDFKQMSITQSSWWKNEILNTGIVKVDNIETLPSDERAWFELFNISSFIAIPLLDKKNIKGFLVFNTINRSHQWRSEHVQLIFTISSIIYNSLLRMKYEAKLSQREQQLREAHKIAKMGYWEYHLSSKRRLWSQEVFHILGLNASLFNPTEQGFYRYVHPNDLPRVKESLQQAVNNGKTDTTYRIIRPDGEVIYVHELAVIRKDALEKTKLIGTIQDITEQVLIEQKLTFARQEAERSSKAKSEFLSCMSHELRTPLNAILGFSQILQNDSNLDTSYKDLNNEVLVAGNHLLNLINDVLDLSKIESGQLSLSNELLDLDVLIQESIKLTSNLPIAENIEIIIKGVHGIKLYADRMKLKQVLLNILSNAIKYNRKNGIVTIDVQSISINRIKISIIDTGEGIESQYLSQIFIPFNRLDQENSGIEGTGIGLAITKKIIEKMGGSIQVKSIVGVGSTFDIEIETEDSQQLEIQHNDEHTNLKTETFNKANKKEKTILYIEDNISNVKLMEKIIGLQKHLTLYTAQTSELGIELANSLKPDLILLDIRLPDMDGYELLSIFKGNNDLKDTIIIALTAEAMPTDLFKGKNSGFVDYLTKPIDFQLFNEKLEYYL